MRVIARVASPIALIATILAGTALAGVSKTADPGGDAKGAGLSAKERQAIDIRSLTLSGDESVGLIATVKFAGNITNRIGQGHLRRARVQLVLEPASPDAAAARLTTKGPGIVGKTTRNTRSKKVGVLRDGRNLTFFIVGSGFSGVGTAEVQVLVPSRSGGASAADEKTADTTGPVPAPQGGLSCSELKDKLAEINDAIAFSEVKLALASKALKKTKRAIAAEQITRRLAKLLGRFVGRDEKFMPSELEAIKGALKDQIDELSGDIFALRIERIRIKERLAKCKEPPSPCTGTLERSSGTGSFTAANHIRVRANCSQAIGDVIVKSLSGDTFDACAVTQDSAHFGCRASGDTLEAFAELPASANTQLEFYGRVVFNADGRYQVTIRAADETVLHQYQETVP